MREVHIYKCIFCSETYDNNDAIICHLLNAHDTDKTVRKLKKQLKSSKTLLVKSNTINNKGNNNLYKQHPRQVRNYRKEYYCDICDYKTVYLSTYKRHLLTHEKDAREHKCMFCSYAAIQPYNLKIHLEMVHPFGEVEPAVVDKDYVAKLREKFV